jgi:uncharacterized membrane protein
MDYLSIKTLHILSSVLMVGTGFGTAFYLFFANRSGSVEAIAVVSRLVVKADWWFTTPAVIIQPLSGAWLIHQAGYPWTPCGSSPPWAVCPGRAVLAAGGLVPDPHGEDGGGRPRRRAAPAGPLLIYARRWERLGYPAFSAMVVVYVLMVFKPV